MAISDHTNVLQKAAKGLSILFVTKILSRIVDFVLNILVLRDVEPSIYGLTMHYMVFTNIALFYAKTCLKNAYQKRGQKASAQETSTSARNLMIFGVFITAGIGISTGFLWNYWYSHLNDSFSLGLACYVIACILESMCEPLLSKYILAFDYSVGAKAEAVAFFSKTLFLFTVTKLALFPTLINFGLAQIFYALLMFISCLYFGGFQTMLLKRVQDKSYFVMQEMSENGKQLTILSFFKLVSQELEKLVMINMRQANIQQQSEFLLISNIGSMVPRYIYAPIEEISFNVFAKLAHKSKEDAFDKNEDNNLNKDESKQFIQKTETTNEFNEAQDVLGKVLKVVHIIGGLAMAFGIPYASAFLTLLYGDKWNYPQCVLALQTYCIYEWIMGLNGISEAFVQGTIQKEDLKIYRLAIFTSTVFYIASCFYLVDFGSAGLILACILSMVSRIAVSFYYIYFKVFASHNTKLFEFLVSSFPNAVFIIGCIVSLFVGFFIVSSPYLAGQPLKQLIIGAANAGVLVLYIAKTSGKQIQQLLTKNAA